MRGPIRPRRARDAAFALIVAALALAASAVSVVGPPGDAGTSAPTLAVEPGATPGGSAPSLGSAPSSPPVAICGNASELTGPSSAPPGAVTIPAGNNSDLTASYQLATNTTYWLAPGVHTLGTGPYSQFQPDEGDTFLGAPGAIIDGQGLNQFAFTFDPDGSTANVTIEYLTVRNFTSGEGEGVVNQNGEPNWTVEHNTIGPNEFNGSNPGGAGVMLGSGSVVEYNCLVHNGEYGFGSFGGSSNLTLAYNEIAYNDYYGGYDQPGSPIQCGCSGGGKFWISTDATVVDNYVHDNGGVGVWVDTDNAGFLIAHNYLSDNYGEGVIYEISYNGLIENNTFVRNALGGGPLIGGFPDSALYISESGFDGRVANPFHASSFLVYGNVFEDNWGGVVVWENSNRYCSDGSDGVCTLVDPAVFTLTSCAAHLAERSPVDYYDGCRWKAQNVSVAHNLFAFDPADIGSDCTVANYCGENGLFSTYGEPPYSGPAVPTNITFRQHNEFSDNVYDGPWGFEAWSQGNLDNPVNWTVWRAPVTDACSTAGENASGTCDSGFDQDAGSAYNSGGGPVLLSFVAAPPTVAVGGATQLVSSVVGGVGPLTYAYAGLPVGCVSSNTSALPCTPRAAGEFAVRLFVNDTAGNDATATAPLQVNGTSAPPPPAPPASPSSGGGDWWTYVAIGTVAGIAGISVTVVLIERRRARSR